MTTDDSPAPAKPMPRQVLPLYTRLQLRRDRQVFRIGFIAGRVCARAQQAGLIFVGFAVFGICLAAARWLGSAPSGYIDQILR